jgi:hypothetical protein
MKYSTLNFPIAHKQFLTDQQEAITQNYSLYYNNPEINKQPQSNLQKS